MTILKKILSTTVLLGAGTIPGHAQDVTLRVADSLPVGHYIAENLLKPFMAKVEETGSVGFEYFPAQQLGKAKDMLSLTQTGVTDIGYVGPSYISDKLPLSSVGELPEAFSTSCQGTMAFWELAKPGGALDEAEFAPEGMRVLMVLVLSPYQIFASKEIGGLDSLKGMKVRSTGGAKDIALTKLGAVPVQMAAPETREALSRGTVDAIAFPNSSIMPYDLAPHLEYATEGANFGSFVATYMISQSRFDSLPQDVQKAMTEAGEHATNTACKAVEVLDKEDQGKIADAGVEYVSFSGEDGERLRTAMGSVGDEWAAELDTRGKPGRSILKVFRDALSGK